MARDKQFKTRDKKTHRMTRGGLVEVNQTTGEQERISLRGAEFQLRQGAPDLETAPLREQPRTGHARQPTQRQTQAFMVDSTSAEGRLDAPSGADFDVQPTDSLPRQASDVPVTGSPGHSSAHTDSGARSYHTEGGRLRESAHLPEAPTPEHRQSGSGYYQQFQETPTVMMEKYSAEPAATSQRETPTANTGMDVHPFVSVERSGSATPNEEPSAISQQVTDLPLTPKPATNHAARDVPVDAPLSSDSAGVASLPEHPGRLRFEAGSAPKLRDKQRQSGTKYARKFTQDVEAATQTTTTDSADHSAQTTNSSTPVSEGKPPIHGESAAPVSGCESHSDSGTAPPPGKKSSRLQFDTEELPPQTALERKIERLQGKIGKTDAKLKKAQEHLPTKRKMRSERTFDTEKGKPQRKIYFEQSVKSQREHLKGALPTRPVKAGVGAAVGFAHGKIHQVEQENVEVEAAHKGELIAESAARRAYRQHKTAPYRRVEKLSRTAARQHTKLTYQETLRDNQKLRGNAVSRFVQKQKIKRQYAKAAKDAKRAAQAAKKAGTAAASGMKAIASFASQHPVAFGVVALILLLMLITMSTFGSCTNMAGSAMAAILSGSYVAEDQDIDSTERSYTDWETELQLEIDNAERDHPGYDEYRYDLDEIGHDPYELLAYLTAKYRDYTFAEVQGELREIFAEQYTLEFVEEVEIRYYEDEDGNEIPYEWYILNINLTTKPLSDILSPRMDTEQTEIFDTLMTSKGNRQYSISPFAFDWLPRVTSTYGWRVHPISGAKDFHNAVDIAVAEGTPILAGHDGRVVTASYDADGYGWYITLDGKNGLSTRYAHCSSLLVSVGQEVKKGETIAKSGNTGNSTGPHLHFEVRMGGETLNPLFFAMTSGEESEE